MSNIMAHHVAKLREFAAFTAPKL